MTRSAAGGGEAASDTGVASAGSDAGAGFGGGVRDVLARAVAGVRGVRGVAGLRGVRGAEPSPPVVFARAGVRGARGVDVPSAASAAAEEPVFRGVAGFFEAVTGLFDPAAAGFFDPMVAGFFAAGVRGVREAGRFASAPDSAASSVRGGTLGAASGPLAATPASSGGGTSEPGVESVTGPRYQPAPTLPASRLASVSECHKTTTNTRFSTGFAPDPDLSQVSWLALGGHKEVSCR